MNELPSQLLSGAAVLTVLTFVLGVPSPPAVKADADGPWHRIEVFGGFAGGADGEVVVGPSTVRTSSGISPFGGLGYLYGRSGRLTYTVGLQAVSLDTETRVAPTTVDTRTSTVTAFLVGARYYLNQPADGPYLAAAAGPVFANENSTSVSGGVTIASHRESTLGGEMAAGLDVPVSGSLSLAAEVSYLLSGEFGTPVGGRRRADGARFTLRLGWTFGGPGAPAADR